MFTYNYNKPTEIILTKYNSTTQQEEIIERVNINR